MEDTIKNLETLLSEVTTNETTQMAVMSREHVLAKTVLIISLTDTTIDTPTRSKSIKEEMINITLKNQNIEIKMMRLTKDREEETQVSLMKEVRCLMMNTGSLKFQPPEKHMIIRGRILPDQEIMMIGIKITTISKGLLMQLIRKIIMIANNTRKM